ncbi:ejaculatory bulb-specific protein 3-like [Nylanderia fulva]|uniref:ejaculatory bulb-specific protein 3-like n=1 Tax=Nylanderia fulva TaxID=613905 RepID=UPI0010FADE15|nr:ejaculatory bulb-specific protein 3-like [Nylanderia fulva]
MIRLNCIVSLIGIALLCVLAEELYTDQYDDIDVKNILSNEKLRLQYYNCYMDTGPCITSDAKFFRDVAGEALQTQCKRCTEKQKEMMDTIIGWYSENQPVQWENIVRKSLEDMKKKNAA